MDENKEEKEQITTNEEQPRPKKRKVRAKDVIAFLCLGVAVACVIALLVLFNCST